MQTRRLILKDEGGRHGMTWHGIIFCPQGPRGGGREEMGSNFQRRTLWLCSSSLLTLFCVNEEGRGKGGGKGNAATTTTTNNNNKNAFNQALIKC